MIKLYLQTKRLFERTAISILVYGIDSYSESRSLRSRPYKNSGTKTPSFMTSSYLLVFITNSLTLKKNKEEVNEINQETNVKKEETKRGNGNKKER